MLNTIHISNDMLLTLANLGRSNTGETISNATVQATLRDSGGSTVAGTTWPLTASAVSGNPGDYQVTLPSTLTLTAGAAYNLTVVASGGGLPTATWVIPLKAQTRSKSG